MILVNTIEAVLRALGDEPLGDVWRRPLVDSPNLVEALAKGESMTLPDGTVVRKTTGNADRYKVRFPGQRQRTVTGTKAMTQLLEAHSKED